MSITCDYVYNYFGIPKKEEIDNFIKKFDAIFNKYLKLKFIDEKLIRLSR